MNTTDSNQHLEALTEIKEIMERSSRFLSLSGLSGVLAGLFAIAGAVAAYIHFDMQLFGRNDYSSAIVETGRYAEFIRFFFIDGVIVLGLSVFFATLLSYQKAKKNGVKVRTRATRLLLINMIIPLIVGAAFVFIMMYHQLIEFAAPSTLVFYGLALLNASKYTFSDIRGLGMSEIVLGLVGMVFTGYGLQIWALGFGILHILYGIIMWYKYDRQTSAGK